MHKDTFASLPWDEKANARASKAERSRMRLSSAARRKTLLLGGLSLFVLLLFAWIDGGEEPIHAITEPITVPPGEPS